MEAFQVIDILTRIGLLEIDNRLVYRRGKWYVRTREIPERGPYDTRLEAVEGLYRHVAICSGRLSHCNHAEAAAFMAHSVQKCCQPACDLCADLLAVLPVETAIQLNA
ncbi:hypothetical protein DET50_10482 [Marinobacter pelagius]|uniref:DUF6316 domain-containing protein n=1 Tax=Marinobacter pelagius TaxID=379482 RepID=A0A366GXL0_9GAMM|nr:DUF6316 family protein [Marinobacter pelagius]RBP32313.1 hypothetical protein DET50_10482 [Marinobacter pelagius]